MLIVFDIKKEIKTISMQKEKNRDIVSMIIGILICAFFLYKLINFVLPD